MGACMDVRSPGPYPTRRQVCYEVWADDFLYLEICVSRRPILRRCVCIFCYVYAATSRRRPAGAYLEVGPLVAC